MPSVLPNIEKQNKGTTLHRKLPNVEKLNVEWDNVENAAIKDKNFERPNFDYNMNIFPV
jgi:hypothetical protein